MTKALALTIATTAAWVVAIAMTLLNYSDYSERWDQANSAPQVTQIANEFVVGVIPWFVAAVGVTCVCIVVALTELRHAEVLVDH